MKDFHVLAFLAIVLCAGFVTTCAIHETNQTKRTAILMQSPDTQAAPREASNPLLDN